MKINKTIAINELERHKNYYPAGALDDEQCFYNAQVGDCGSETCKAFALGNCPIKDELLAEEAERNCLTADTK